MWEDAGGKGQPPAQPCRDAPEASGQSPHLIWRVNHAVIWPPSPPGSSLSLSHPVHSPLNFSVTICGLQDGSLNKHPSWGTILFHFLHKGVGCLAGCFEWHQNLAFTVLFTDTLLPNVSEQVPKALKLTNVLPSSLLPCRPWIVTCLHLS